MVDCITVAPVKTGVQPSKTGSKMKLQKSSSLSVNRSRSDMSTRSSSLSVAGTGATGPASEREARRQRGRERLSRELVRTLAETHFIHAEVCNTCTTAGGLVISAVQMPHSVQCISSRRVDINWEMGYLNLLPLQTSRFWRLQSPTITRETNEL